MITGKNSKITIALVLAIVSISLSLYFLQQTYSTKVLRVSTTTSLYATGLLDRLADEYRRLHPDIIIQFIAVGSGEALRKASRGDADMVLVHAPNLEKQYVEDNTLVEGDIFAYNFFIIVGPKEDPAGIRGLDPLEAFRKIYEAGIEGRALFVSRGDESGTHQREKILWSLVGLKPSGDWYIESGSGMSKTLLIANEKNAYTLADTGTYLKLKLEDRLPYLEALVTRGDVLINIYSVYIVNPEKISGVNYELAKEFKEFLVSGEGQGIIGSYGVDKYGKPLFYPATGKKDELKKQWLKITEWGNV